MKESDKKVALILTILLSLCGYVLTKYVLTWNNPENQINAISCCYWLMVLNSIVLYIIPDKKPKEFSDKAVKERIEPSFNDHFPPY